MTDPASATTDRMPAIDTDCHEAGTLGGIRRPIGARVVDGAKFQAAVDRASAGIRRHDMTRLLGYSAIACAFIALAVVVATAVIVLSR